MIRNSPNQVIGAGMVNATSGAAYVGTVTVYITIDGGAQAIGSVGGGICTAEGNGYYTYHPTAAETNGLLVGFTFTGTGAIPTTIQATTLTAAQQAALSQASGSVVSTVRTIGTDALLELGFLQPGETMAAELGALVLLRVQNMLDAWQADALTFVRQLQTIFTLPAGQTSVNVGPGQAVPITRPRILSSVNFIVPGTVPAVEVPIGIMGPDAYAALSIKNLSSSLPMQCFPQVDITGAFETLTFWPQVSQNVQIAIYTPQAIDIPVSLDTVLVGPPGYAEAFMYNLADRLSQPVAGHPTTPDLQTKAATALQTIAGPNVQPGELMVDPALMPNLGAGYNVLSDRWTAGNVR